MRVALNMENSQAAKNAVVLKELTDVASRFGHQVFNVGMADEQDHHLTYIHLGIQAGILLNSGAVDFVVTGCGTGQGSLMSLNAHPGVVCGYCLDPSDAFLYTQINNGNAISLPFAKGWGWAAELNLRYTFEKLFEQEVWGDGYPKERREPQARNAGILVDVKKAVAKDSYVEALKACDQELVKQAVSGERFKECFFAGCKCPELKAYVESLLA